MDASTPSIPPQHFTLAGAAAAFAVRAHDGQVRTGTLFPYVTHPLGVAHILRELYDDEILEAAGYLHDVVEDTDVTEDDILGRFGPDVTFLVMAVTRRQGWSLEQYAYSKDVMRLKAADVLDNVLDTIRGLHKGHDVWSRFGKGKGKTDYWRKVQSLAFRTLSDASGPYSDADLLGRLARALEEVEGLR